jgi:hypothetical protein
MRQCRGAGHYCGHEDFTLARPVHGSHDDKSRRREGGEGAKLPAIGFVDFKVFLKKASLPSRLRAFVIVIS